jgi:hypothetical protein
MGKKRLGLGSFFGGLVIERAVPDSHGTNDY